MKLKSKLPKLIPSSNNAGALYSLTENVWPPSAINNAQLMPNRVIQKHLANCVVISVCNIIEAKYWQKSGHIVKFNYERIYNEFVEGEPGSGISYNSINKLLTFINNIGLCAVKRTALISDSICKNEQMFVRTLKSAIHSFQFASIGCSAGMFKNAEAGWFARKEPHTLTVCGYNEDGFIIRSTDADQESELTVGHKTLYESFEVFSCFQLS